MKVSISLLVTVFALLIVADGNGQAYSEASVFAHNDYVQPVPFYTAYKAKTGYMEADIFLVEDNLYVAHTFKEIDKGKTLESLYLKRFEEVIKEGMTHPVTLMIDLKTKGVPTLDKLVDVLKKHPALITSDKLTIGVSGDMPDVSLWNKYPDFIHFDGRPGVQYSVDQLQRLVMVSTAFQQCSRWRGEGPLPEEDRKKITDLRDKVHAQGKKLRFWGTPDTPECWKLFMDLNIDILGTDHVPELIEFLK